MSAVKDVDLEAMPTSIFLNDDDDDDDVDWAYSEYSYCRSRLPTNTIRYVATY